MARTANVSESVSFQVTVSKESVRLLDDIAERGIWGRNRAEVASRFVDQALQGFVDAPKLHLKKTTGRRR